MTDIYRVSDGYKPAFEKLLNKAGIHRHQVVVSDIYNLVDKPLKKKGNETVWRFDPEKLQKIRTAFDQRIRAVNPSLIVISCPAILGVLTGGESRSATIDKMRGGVYQYEGITCIITYPITAINQRVDERILVNDDGEEDRHAPYRIPHGAQILNWDWQKVGRFFAGKSRKLPPFFYSVCRTVADCIAARDFLRECVLISVDSETGNYPAQLTCVGYTGLLPNGAMHSFVIPFSDNSRDSGCFWDSDQDFAIAWSIVKDINNLRILKTLQNGGYDCSYFVRDRLGLSHYFLDLMILWWSLYMEMPKKLGFIVSVLCDNYQYWKDDIKGEENERVEGPNMERYWRYCALDTYWTMCGTLYMVTLLLRNPAMQVNYRDAMLRNFSGFRMSMRGLRVDYARRDYHRENLNREMEEKIKMLRFLIDDDEFNINSPQQKCSLLYDVFGLKPRTAKGRFVDPNKEAKGKNAPSAGAIPIKMAKTEHPLFKYILEHLEAALEPRVQMSNLFGFPDESVPGGVRGGLYLPNGRFQYSLNPVGTETTRYSGKKSNFWIGGNPQNLRDTYKDWLIADEGHIIFDVDYSQSDDVFMAYESQDPDKMAVIESGRDVHAVNGELFFGVPYDKIVAGKRAHDPWITHPITGVRQISKKGVHGCNFQMAAWTLYILMQRDAVVTAAELLGHVDAAGWDQNQLVAICDLLIRKYRNKYRRLTRKEYYKEIADALKTLGRITNCWGITRTFLGEPNDDATQREATAYIGQSGTAGNMNRTENEINWGFIPQVFRDGPNPDRHCKPLMMDYESHGFGFHLQVHDNFLSQLNLRHPKWKEAAYNLLQVMNRPVIIKGREVRIRVEAELGLRWGHDAMTEWDGKDPYDLDRIVLSTRQKEAA